jgi:hypothetical protein
MDADALEELQLYTNELFRVTILDQGRIDGLNAATIPDQEGIEIDEQRSSQTNQNKADDPDTMSIVVIDHFPSGSPGAPIPGMPHGTSTHESWRESMESIWAPFRSQKDWEIAHWVKTRGSSSSAVDDFLAIPDVCPYFLSDYCL